MIWWLWWNVARRVTWWPPPPPLRPPPPPRLPSRASSWGNWGRPAAGSREVWRSEAESGEGEPRSARTGGGAGPRGVESGQGHGGYGGRRLRARDPRGGGQRAACAPAGARGVPPRSARPGPALWSPATAQHPLPPQRLGPRRPVALVTATRTPDSAAGRGRGGESRAPHAPGPGPRRCVFMNSINGALTAHTKPFLLQGRDGVGEGLADWNAFFFFLNHRSFSLKTR